MHCMALLTLRRVHTLSGKQSEAPIEAPLPSLQVVMRLLGKLAGITPDTFPRVPFEIVNTLTLKAGLGPLQFAIVRSDQAPLPTASRSSTGAAAAAGNATDTAASAPPQGSAAAAGAALAPEPTPTPQARQREKRQRQEEAQKGAYRGRAHVGGVWLSSTCRGESRRVVKVRCGEQVLMQLRRDRHWLQLVDARDGRALGVRDRPPPSAGARAPGSTGGAAVRIESGIAEGSSVDDVVLPTLRELQREGDAPLDERMRAVRQRTARATTSQARPGAGIAQPPAR